MKQPDEDDWKKLIRLLTYLNGTIDLPLRLSAKDLNIIKWFTDASFATRHDMRSQTGAMMTLGKGGIYCTAKKQKLNTKSSTEAELVGVDDVLGQALWTRYFLEAQGYEIQQNVMFQDNKSAILLEKNGMKSSSKRTRHLNIRYFFVQDKIERGEISMEYCPTGEMIGDFFTKPLQGGKFMEFRRLIMGEV